MTFSKNRNKQEKKSKFFDYNHLHRLYTMKLAYTCGFREKEALLEELDSLNSNSSSSAVPSVGRLPAAMNVGWDKHPIPSFEDNNNDQPGSSSEEESKKKPQSSSKKRRSEGGMDDIVNPQPSKRMRLLLLQDDKKTEPPAKDAIAGASSSPLAATTAYQRITRDLDLMSGNMKNMKITKMTALWNTIEEEFRKEVYSHKDGELIEKFTIQWRRMTPATDDVEVIRDIYFSGNYVRLAAAAVQLMVEEYKKSPQMMDAMEPTIVRFVETPSLTALRLLLVNIRSVIVRMRATKSKPYVIYDVMSSYSWPTYTTPAEIVRVVSESVPSASSSSS
jgi:hypothetical protein